ncbi:MAG: hypothetical protein RLZZ413_1798, partial [Pseudomonadota bacterium]
ELLAAPADHAAILARSGGTPPTDPWGTSILLQKKAP